MKILTPQHKKIDYQIFREKWSGAIFILLFLALIFMFFQMMIVEAALMNTLLVFILIGSFVLITRNPVTGTYLFILIEFSSFHQYMPYFMSISPSFVLIFVILFVLVAKLLIKKEKLTFTFPKPQSILLLIFFGMCILNSILNDVFDYHEYYVLKEPIKRLLLFFLVVNFVNSFRIVRNIFRILAFLIVVQTFNALIFYYIPNIHQPEILHSLLIDPLAISGHPNSLGAFLVILLPILFYMLKYEVEFWRRFALLSFIMCIPTVIFTFSRSAFFILLPFFFWFLFKRKEVVKPLGIFAIILTSLLLLILPQYLERFRDLPTDAGTGRIYLWQSGLKVILANPLFGIGFAKFGDYYSIYAVPNTPFFQSGKFHNMYIDIGALFGIPMLVAFLAIIFYTLKEAFQFKRTLERKNYFKQAFLIESLIVSIMLFLIGGFIFHYWLAPIFYVLLGLIISIKRISSLEAIKKY